MATANIPEIDDLISCPVCYEHYRDPRRLKCVHQFCLQCLEKIAVTKPNGQREITCPTCRAVTPLTTGSQARDLQKPLVANELQELIKKLLIPDTKKIRINCAHCDDKFAMATKHCYECHDNMCGRCYGGHQDVPSLATHKTVPISDTKFCQIHHDVINLYCMNCKVGICNICSRKEHTKHTTETIEKVAAESRDQVRSFIKQQIKFTNSPGMLKHVQGKVQEIERQRDTVVGKLDLTLDLIKSLEDKVKKTRSEVVANTSADIKALKLYTSDLSELIASQGSLFELDQYLVEKASDPEVVARATELLSLTSLASVTSPTKVSIPSIGLDTTEEMLKKLDQQIEVNYEFIKFPSAPDHTNVVDAGEGCVLDPITHVTRQHTFSTSSTVWGMVFNPARSQLVVKTDDKAAPIKVYDLKGNKLTQFGGGKYGLSGYGRMSMDSHRDLYLAACEGHLTTVTMNGRRKDRIDMEGCKLRGVTYIRENDLYVVSDVTSHTLKLIDPRTKSIVRSFGSRGTSPGQFSFPSFITTYTDQGKPVIVVSDRINHRVQLLDLYGTHLHTYGSYGDGDGQLYRPNGVVVDPTGRIIVCDYNNNRVVSFWREDGQDKWQCLIPQTRPHCIDIDIQHKTLATSKGNDMTLYSWI